MFRWLLVFSLALSLAATAGCENSSGGVEGDPSPTPQGDDDDDDGGTPTGNATYSLVANPTTWQCAPNPMFPGVYGVTSTWQASTVEVAMGDGSFTPLWNLSGVTVADTPSGTLTGDDFDAMWSWCQTDGANTYHHTFTWAGTLSADGSTFSSTIHEKVEVAAGVYTTPSACAAVTGGPFADCVSGFDRSLSGTRQ